MSLKKIFYDDPRFDYQQYWQNRNYENESEKIALKKILKLIPNKKAKELIDIGGGFGRLTPQYAPFFKKCLLVDPSFKLIKQAKEITKDYPNLEVKRSFVEKINTDNQSFDVALLIRVTHHLKDLSLVVKEVDRILKPKGFLVLEFANKTHLKNVIKETLKGNLRFLTDHTPKKVAKKSLTPFFNYHPNQIKSLLFNHHFKIISCFSVSNFRHPYLKKLIPLKILLKMESCQQNLTAKKEPCLSPSVFLLAQKP